MDLALAKRGVEIVSTLTFDKNDKILNDSLDQQAFAPLVELLKIAIEIESLDEENYEEIFGNRNHFDLGKDAIAALAKLQADDAIQTIITFANEITKAGETHWIFECFPADIQNFKPIATETFMQEVLNQKWEVDTRISILQGVSMLASADSGAMARIIPLIKQALDDAANLPIRVNTALMTTSIELGLIELAEVIEHAFSIDRIDCAMIGGWEIARRDLHVPGLGLPMPLKPYNSLDTLRAFMGVGCFSKVPVFMHGKVIEEDAMKYLETAQKVFERSPQGRAVLKDNERALAVYEFLLLGVYGLGVTVDRMSLKHVNKILLTLYPTKVALDLDLCDDTIDKLEAFWRFVDCVHHLEFAAPIADHIADLRTEFRHAMCPRVSCPNTLITKRLAVVRICETKDWHLSLARSIPFECIGASTMH